MRQLERNEITDIGQLILGYWFTLYTTEQEKTEVPKLKHSRNYSLGNDLWGLIHDVYGKDKVFDTIRHLDRYKEVLNSALTSIGREDLLIM